MTTTERAIDALLDHTAPLEPVLPDAQWNDLVAAAQQLRDQVTIAEHHLKHERAERLIELAPHQEALKAMETRLDQIRTHLKQRAVASFAQHRAIGKTFGGVQLREQHRIIVEDFDQAIDLLAAVAMVTEGGELVPLIEWKPVINEAVLMTFIRTLEDDPSLWPKPAFKLGDAVGDQDAMDLFNREARGWPGIVRATLRTDVAAYTLVVQKEPERPAHEAEGGESDG